jgi:ribosomal protein L35
MPGKAKTGKQKSHSGAKKRVSITATGKVRTLKAAHNHRLIPKNDRQLNLGGRLRVMTGKIARNLKSLLSF